ncbi:BRCT domain-containing protein [Corynebacterium glyciniphilum]|uniref:BRCT domain-containing protein n=1 Tax=Corynebacterium glyciniphilum TaxID=1404244 RepID=UPI00264E6DB0|nr:BRCT domain-containing protein [Corynebacterium glyciniphilum]MDN6704929.1 BRCT domain-containing protein [Corynebacterium glyciniphilum]
MSTTAAAHTVTAHGADVTVDGNGVQVRRTPMGQTLLPAELAVTPAELRGWYRHTPTDESPGWIQFSLATPPDNAVLRPVRGFPATRGASNIVVFAPGQQEQFTQVHQLLSNLQAGFPLDTAPTSPVETDAASATSPASAPEPTQSAQSAQSAQSSPQQTWQRVATPDTVPEANTEADANGPVFGQNVTVTGDFAPYEKGEVWDMIAEAGATVGKNVTKKTTLLVIGEWGSVTSKEKRARELKDKGQDITLWSFDELLSALGKSRRPDLDEVKGTSAPF